MATMHQYLDKALTVIQKYGIQRQDTAESGLANLLQGVVHVDEPKVLAIAQTVGYIGTFSQLVRDNVESMNVAERYNQITEMFNSIREDSKKLVGQLEDGKVDYKEKAQNLWMRLSRGSTHSRFEKIRGLFNDVSEDTEEQLDKEEAILEAYINFRFALKESETLAYDVLSTQEQKLKSANEKMQSADKNLEDYSGSDDAQSSRLQMDRDLAVEDHRREDATYQLIKDVAEDLKNGYNIGETLIAKLQQTHGVKQRVFQRSISFFTTNEHVFTTLDATYTSQRGLHEQTQTLEGMKEGINKGIEDVAELGRNLETAALKAGYGSTYNPSSIQKLVDAIVQYQTESQQMISDLRKESTQSVEEIEKLVDEGKRKVARVIAKYDNLSARVDATA